MYSAVTACAAWDCRPAGKMEGDVAHRNMPDLMDVQLAPDYLGDTLRGRNGSSSTDERHDGV